MIASRDERHDEAGREPSPVRSGGKQWVGPEVRRIVAGSAESGDTVTSDDVATFS